jgi:hypothetical protein
MSSDDGIAAGFGEPALPRAYRRAAAAGKKIGGTPKEHRQVWGGNVTQRSEMAIRRAGRHWASSDQVKLTLPRAAWVVLSAQSVSHRTFRKLLVACVAMTTL